MLFLMFLALGLVGGIVALEAFFRLAVFISELGRLSAESFDV
jgi:hypothetical protein